MSSALRYAMGLAAAWFLFAAVGALEPIERLTAQAWTLLRPAPGFHAPVAIVAIDEHALRAYGQMPWDRRLFARLLDRLAAAHAAVVGIDVAFNEPARDPAEDRALVAAVRRIPTVLPTYLAFVDAGHSRLSPIDPLPSLVQAASALGSIQLATRQQTQVWEVEPYQAALGRLVPAFPVAMVGVYQGHPWRPAPASFFWRDDPALIDFRGPANTAFQVSAADVLDGRTPPADLAGKLVLVGATAIGLPDTNFAVPDTRGGPMAGVELSANVVDNLLAGHFQRRTSLPALALLLGLVALFPGWPLARRGAGGRRSLALATAAVVWLVISFEAFRHGVWLDTVPVLGLLASCYLAGVFAERRFLLESRAQLLARYAQDLASEARRQRSRIEGELHDGLQQLMVVVAREARQAIRLEPAPEVGAHLAFIEEIANEAHQEVQRLRADLLPEALREEGLAGAVRELANEASARGLAAAIEVVDWTPLDHDLEVELYWLAKEALNNIEKHAGASRVEIRLDGRGPRALVEIRDDGRGFTPPDLTVPPRGLEHTGLHRMWLRIQGNRGDMQVISRPGEGTTVRLSVPSPVTRKNA